jgi:hypothetical protein
MSNEALGTLVLGLLAVGFAGAEFLKPPPWLRWILGFLSAGCFVAAIAVFIYFAPFNLRSPIVVGWRWPVTFPSQPVAEPKNIPRLKVEGETFQLSFGGLTSGGPVSVAEGLAARFPCFGTDPWITPSGQRLKSLGCFVESCPVHVFIEHGYAYLNTAIYGGPLPCVQINHNRIVPDSLMGHPSWDFNSNDRALEVVNGFGFPMFQMFVEPPNRITVRGVFPFPNDEVLIQDIDKGYPSAFFDAKVGPNEWRDDFHLKAKPLFKYPSWRHPGELAE